MPHPQPQTNNNYIDDDLNYPDLGSPPPTSWSQISVNGLAYVVRLHMNVGGSCTPNSLWAGCFFIHETNFDPGWAFNGIVPQVGMYLTLTYPGAGIQCLEVLKVIDQNEFNNGNGIMQCPSDFTTNVTSTSYTSCPCNVPYGNLDVGFFTGAPSPTIYWDCSQCITGLPPTATHYCSDFNCMNITSSNFAQVASSGTAMHLNVDDCIACCGGISTPTYSNGSPNPHYQSGTPSNAAYVAWANVNSLPIYSSGTFINYMWEVHGITSCGQVTCGGLANPWPCCDPLQCTGSDIRLKENINKVGVSKSGIPIYTFNYKGENQLWSGTIAQDLISLGKQDAVTIMSNGYYGVYYDMIDVDMIAV